MSDERPFREPCDGVSLCGLGPLWQHGTNTQINIAGTNCTTMVPDWASSGTIPAYERWTPDPGGPASCDTHFCVPEGAPCAAWGPPYPTNTFAFSGTNIDMSLCHKTGFKNVQARRCWNGRFGYTDIEASNSADTWDPCGDGSTVISWRSYHSDGLHTRYNQLGISATWEWVHNEFDGPPVSTPPITTTKDQSASLTQVINSAGILDTTALSLSPNTSQTEPLVEYPQNAFAALQKGFKHFGGVVADMVVGTISDAISTTWTSTSLTVTNSFQIETITWDVGAGTFHRVIQQNYPDGGGYLTIVDESYTLSETGLSYEKVTYNRVGDPGPSQGIVIDQITTEVTATLSSPITDSDVYADIKTLLGYWDLSDDTQYPWRTDLKVSVAPLVSRDELQTQEFESTGFYIRDFGVPVTDPLGNTLGDPDWEGNTGYTLNPNPQTGYAKVAIDFPGHSSGTPVDIPISNPFSHCAATSFAIVGGSLPPGVSLNTTTGEITGTVGDDGHYGVTILVTGAAVAATGSVLGAPLPAGYRDSFNFAFLDVRGCCFRPPDNPGFQTWTWYQVGWGQNVSTFNSNTGCHLPLNATQWNNWFESVNKPQGAWLFYGDKGQAYYATGCVSSDAPSGAGDAGLLVGCKYAEILEMWPSQNFARPAGDDKFVFDENHVFCAVNISGSGAGSTWTITDTISGAAPPDGTDFSGLWGGPVVGGFYSVSSYSGGTLTLGAKSFDVPSNWASKSNSDEEFCFGKLRFSTAPALLGRVAVTPDGPGTTFTFESPQPAFGMNSSTHQEQVDLWDAAMASVASNITATRVNDSTFTTSSAHTTARYVTIHGAPAWYVNDTRPKGDYAVLTWASDFRSFGEFARLDGVLDCSSTQVTQPITNAGGGPIDSATQFASFSQTADCLPFGRCNPRVVCISPSGETWPNGTTYGFPETFSLDDAYGSKWWGYVQATMTDLFWQQPHRPCNIKPCAKWLMDGGICADDQPWDGAVFACPGDDGYIEGESLPPTYYYAHVPQVETRLTVPDNYGMGQDESGPSLPSGVQVGWLSPVLYSTGDVALPPQPPGVGSDQGTPNGTFTEWDFHNTLCQHQDCRFNYVVPGCDPAME